MGDAVSTGVEGSGASGLSVGDAVSTGAEGSGASGFGVGDAVSTGVEGSGASVCGVGRGLIVASIPFTVNCMVIADGEKSNSVYPVEAPVRRDFVFGFPESVSSVLAPPATQRSVASPRFILFSRSESPSAWTIATLVWVESFSVLVSSTYQMTMPPPPQNEISHSSGCLFSINRYSPFGCPLSIL